MTSITLQYIKPLADLRVDDRIQEVYEWVDSVPLSRPKRNINRDFSDACMIAELVSHFHPKLVELHNYPASGSFQTKLHNWQTVNRRVFKRFGFLINERDLEDCAKATPGAIEKVLDFVKPRLAQKPPAIVTEESSPIKKPKPGNFSAPHKSTDSDEVSNLKDQVSYMSEKISKLEQLIEIKDLKIQALQDKLEMAGVVVVSNKK